MFCCLVYPWWQVSHQDIFLSQAQRCLEVCLQVPRFPWYRVQVSLKQTTHTHTHTHTHTLSLSLSLSLSLTHTHTHTPKTALAQFGIGLGQICSGGVFQNQFCSTALVDKCWTRENSPGVPTMLGDTGAWKNAPAPSLHGQQRTCGKNCCPPFWTSCLW